MQLARFRYGYYAPMEDASLDIRRYIARDSATKPSRRDAQ